MSLPALAPIVGLLVLLELSAGTMAMTLIVDLLGEVGRGFMGTTALICAAILGCALAIAAMLPSPSDLLHEDVAAASVASMDHWAVALLLGILLYAFMTAAGTDLARRVVGTVATVGGFVAVERAAVAFGTPLGSVGSALITFVPAELMCGAAIAGMLLGHWYLISPDLTFRPLRRAVYTMFIALGVQAVALMLVIATASSQARDDLLGARYGLSFWLLVVGAGLLFTAAVNGLTLYFARIRANQPATAMLYVLVISVLMGVIPAHLLYFLSSVPV